MNALQMEMYAFAHSLVLSAGSRLKMARAAEGLRIQEKTSQMDVVTQHDLWVEMFLAGAIRQRYPDHAILSEESFGSTVTGEARYTWVMDPIDGTMNFCRFSRDYTISLALVQGKSGSALEGHQKQPLDRSRCIASDAADSVPLFGLVYDVAGDVMYSARSHDHALVNGCRVLPPAIDKPQLCKAVVAMSLRTMMDMDHMGMNVFCLLSAAQAHRYLGCASLELCRLAVGEFDFYFSSNVYEWDIAAARALITQSGGTVLVRRRENTSGKAGKLYVAAFRDEKLWEEVRDYLPESLQVLFLSDGKVRTLSNV